VSHTAGRDAGKEVTVHFLRNSSAMTPTSGKKKAQMNMMIPMISCAALEGSGGGGGVGFSTVFSPKSVGDVRWSHLL
jgi:hypothetical protein